MLLIDASHLLFLESTHDTHIVAGHVNCSHLIPPGIGMLHLVRVIKVIYSSHVIA